MSFIKSNRKKDPPLLQQDSDIIGEPASVPKSNILDKETVRQLETMLKGKLPNNGIHSDGIRNANIASVVTIACAALFFILFFSMDVPGKILSANVSQPLAAATPVSSNEQPDTDNSITSPHTVVLPDGDMTKDELLTYLGDMSDDDVQMVLEAIQTQGAVNNESPVAGAESGSAKATPSTDPAAALDASIEVERQSPIKIDGSKRLRLVQDLNTTDYNYMYYVAEDGDTMLALSKAFGVSLGQLLELNGLHDADVIRAGEILLFPEDTIQPDLSGE